MAGKRNRTITVRSRKTDPEEHSVTSAAPQASFFLDDQVEVIMVNHGTHIEVRRHQAANSPHLEIEKGPTATTLNIKAI